MSAPFWQPFVGTPPVATTGSAWRGGLSASNATFREANAASGGVLGGQNLWMLPSPPVTAPVVGVTVASLLLRASRATHSSPVPASVAAPSAASLYVASPSAASPSVIPQCWDVTPERSATHGAGTVLAGHEAGLHSHPMPSSTAAAMSGVPPVGSVLSPLASEGLGAGARLPGEADRTGLASDSVAPALDAAEFSVQGLLRRVRLGNLQQP